MISTVESASSAVHFFEHVSERHAMAPLERAGLTRAQVRTAVAPFKLPRKRRKRETQRSKAYGWLKVTVATLPPEGIVVASRAHAEKLQAVARRMGCSVVFRKIGEGPARRVLPALSGAELSLLSSGL